MLSHIVVLLYSSASTSTLVTNMSQFKGWLAISDNGNDIRTAGIAEETDSGLISLALSEQDKKEGRLELRGHKVLVTTKNDTIYAIYY